MLFLSFNVAAVETVTYQQGANGFIGATSTMFASARSQNTTKGVHYFRYDGAQRHYNLEHFELGDLSQKGDVSSAKLIFTRVGGGVYVASEIYVRQILDPDNLGQAYATGWKVADGFRAGANNESRDDSAGSDVKWRLSDPDSPEDLNADYFQGVLKDLSQSPYFIPQAADAVGTRYEVDVTEDVQCMQQGTCVNQGWALFHSNPNANIQNITASSNYDDVQYRPMLVVTYGIADLAAPRSRQAIQQTTLLDDDTSVINLSIETDEAASCKADADNSHAFADMTIAMQASGGDLIHTYAMNAGEQPSQLYIKCADMSDNVSGNLHTFIFSQVQSGGDTGGSDGGTGGDTGGSDGGTGGDTGGSDGGTGGDTGGSDGGNTGTNPSDYVLTKEVITPDFGTEAPAIGETITDPTTGAKITRLAGDGVEDALIVYSRYSPENSAGDSLVVFGSNSTSSKVINRTTSEVIANLTHQDGSTIGENHEVRWDTSGNHPYRIYYIKGMEFWKIEDVRDMANTRVLVKDFSDIFPNSTKIYNDVEGDSSNDSDHWAWMAVHYGQKDNGSYTYLVDAFVHYQISTDTVHSLTPADLAGTNLDIEAVKAAGEEMPVFTYRPNMVEMSPLGTGIVIHMGYKWDDVAYGGTGVDYIGTWFDGAHLWPVDFDYNAQAPVKISISETHSGWAFDENGREMFVSQNNRTDRLDAIYINGENAGYDNRIEVGSHADFGWNMGFHYGKMLENRPGWLFMNTYSKDDSLWAANQFMMIQTKPEEENPVIWRISPAYNAFDGEYRDEAPAAINLEGNRIYWSSNWGSTDNKRSVYMIELPDDWDTKVLE
ncbi:hypothetical protein SG34_007750 [Thalassomonas viridans]|uniref:Uncharacterized protein n=1 Tax=Thalassomonas viridans TaxID=137584 RepID=A0AAE9Z4U4_9GAMM|nr:hypothetical protein [Thalassomonas viridans]WDE06786.1 hypothetical protein SG34_007750 [Thalassomonas viridans]